MYEENGDDGKRKYTVAAIAETFGVSRKTVYRHLEPSAGRRQPGKSARPAAPAGPLATLPAPARDRAGEPAARPRGRPAAGRAHLACPACGREPATRGEALQQREDLAVVWLHLDGDHLTEARHCVACQPHGPVIDVSCSCCGDRPPDHRAATRTRRPARAASAGLAARPRLATSPPNRYAAPITDSRQL